VPDPRPIGRDHAAQRQAILEQHGGRAALAAAINSARRRATSRTAKRAGVLDTDHLRRARQRLAAAATARRKKT
jgi:hypothetical protein